MRPQGSLLLIFDEKNRFSQELSEDLNARGWRLRFVTLDQITPQLARELPDAVIFNLKGSPGKALGEVIGEIKEWNENLPIVCFSAHANVEAAVEMMKEGIYDFIPLPLDKEVIHHRLQKAVHYHQLAEKVFFLERQKGWKGEFWGIVGSHPKMQENFRVISSVAKSRATVLILGESGTGKELVAKAIHALSERSKNKFIDLNCGAIPKELLENELFGHEKGAFTGADRRYIGSFERAHGGTFFLDEICEMELPLQVKLLRVLQDRGFTRIGGTEKTLIDVRVISATNREIQEEVREGRFREDLFYRLNVVPIVIPPLRERRDDIPALAKHFLDLYASENDKMFFEFQPEALEALMEYSWPGNVRELENVIERIVVLNNDSQVKLKHLPEVFHAAVKGVSKAAFSSSPASPLAFILPLKDLERQAIEQAMKKYKGNVAKVSEALEIGQATLYRKLHQYKSEKI